MRLLYLVLLAAACGDGAHAKPDAAVHVDAAPDTGSGSNDIDTTFGTHGTAGVIGGTCVAFAVDASDRPLVVTDDGNGHDKLVRYDGAGQPDPSFTPHALGTHPLLLSKLFVLPSTKLLVTAIDMQTNNAHVYRVTYDGTIDLDLELPAKQRAIIGAAERADGGIDLVGVGNASTNAFSFSRITAAGAVDTTFGDQGVAAPATGNIPPGYFPHAVSIGNGTFVLSGASFAQVNPQGGEGPITGHLLLATDGAITMTTTLDNTQFLDLAGHGGKIYALTDAFPSTTGAVTRYDATLSADATYTTAESSMFDAIYGLYNGGAFAVASDGSVIATNGKTLDRFHADGTARGQDTDPFTFCGIAFDSHDRPLVASSTAVLRLVR